MLRPAHRLFAGLVLLLVITAIPTTVRAHSASMPSLPGPAAFGHQYRPATGQYVIGDCRVFHGAHFSACESVAYMISLRSPLAAVEPISVSMTVMRFADDKTARDTMRAFTRTFDHGAKMAWHLPVDSDVRMVANRVGHVTDALLYRGSVVAFVGLFGFNRSKVGLQETFDLYVISRALMH